MQAFGDSKANFYEGFVEKVWLLWPSSTLQQLKFLTPSKHTVTSINWINDRRLKNIDYSTFDLVGISYFTATAHIAYNLADKIRKKGVPVALGGYHASALPKEAKQHADTVVVGEAEKKWPELLKDLEKRSLKPFYVQKKPLKAEELPCITGINKSLNPVGGIEATRGCINKCNFCSISHSPMGCKLRVKSLDGVIQAIKNLPDNYFIFMDSSLSINRRYSKELFKEMKYLNKKFACFFNANVAYDEELLKFAQEAGCIGCAIGFETISQSNIDRIEKGNNKVKDYAHIVKKLHDYGIAVMSSLAFGFDDDTPDVFDLTLEKLKEWDVDSTGANILTPLPGTKLFTRFQKENRILTKDWSKYDLYHVVFEPKHMTPEELFNGTKNFAKRFYSYPNMISKIFSSIKLGWHPFLGVIDHHLTSKLIYNTTFKFKNI